MAKLTEKAKGMFIISATPFEENGALDLKSVPQMIEFYLACGVEGITILGVMGEANKMSLEESAAFTKAVVKSVKGRMPIVVGVSNTGLDNLVQLSRTVMDLGASGVMVTPMPNMRTDAAIARYFADVFQALGPGIPVCVQDVPWVTNSWMTAATVDSLVREFPQFVMFKHEEDPGLRKLTQVTKLLAKRGSRRVSILGGVGGVYAPLELARGADGMMTGFGYPKLLCDVIDAFAGGKPERGKDIHDAILPYARYELQQGPGLAIRKHVLWQQGALRTPAARRPRYALDSDDHREIADLVRRMKARLDELGLEAGPAVKTRRRAA